jgi:putative transposase
MSARQHDLPFVGRGGPRPGAGRKRKAPRPGVSHKARPLLAARHPVHVTSRLAAGLPSLRNKDTLRRLHQVFCAAQAQLGMRVVVFSIQTNHVHWIAEARDARALARGMQGLHVRLARALNRHWHRTGTVFGDRYHARTLKTPREVRNALGYVLHNARRHGARAHGVDPYSSGAWFDGWKRPLTAPTRTDALVRPVSEARTWLLRTGWTRHGCLEP